MEHENMLTVDESLKLYLRNCPTDKRPRILIQNDEFYEVFDKISKAVHDIFPPEDAYQCRYGCIKTLVDLVKSKRFKYKSTISSVLNCHTGKNVLMQDYYFKKYAEMTIREYIDRVVDRCKDDLYFFLSYFVYIPKQGGGHMKLPINIGTYTQIKMLMNGYSTMLQNPRQGLSTTTMCGIIAWIDIFYGSSISTELIGANNESVNFARMLISDIEYSFNDFMEKCDIRFTNDFIMSGELSNIDTIFFIDSFEFNPNISDLIVNLDTLLKEQEKSNTLIVANSVVNNRLSKQISDSLVDYVYGYPKDGDAFNYCTWLSPSDTMSPLPKNKLYLINYPVNYIFTSKRIEEMKHILPDEKTYLSEIERIRVDNSATTEDKQMTIQEAIDSPIKFIEYIIGRKLTAFEKMVIEKIMEK